MDVMGVLNVINYSSYNKHDECTNIHEDVRNNQATAAAILSQF